MPRMNDDWDAKEKVQMMSGNYKLRIDFFDEYHSSKDPEGFVVVGDLIYFADGAFREKSAGFSSLLVDVPNNPQEIAKNILIYTEAKLKLARDEFENYKQRLQSSCQNIASQNNGNPQRMHPPTADDIHKLKLIKIKVDKWQQKFAAARKNFEELTPREVIERNIATEEVKAQAASALQEIEEIQV